ncbi:MAG: N,N-dimethylformamidase beta subunit family domain-containing protein [Rhizobiaceae bacterium]
MTSTRIFGYTDPLCVKAGEKVDFKVSVEGRSTVSAKIVRILHGDENPIGPGFVEEELETSVPASLAVKRQFTQIGSFAVARDSERRLDAPDDFVIFAHVYPTLLKAERQQIMGQWCEDEKKGYGLGLDPDGHFSFWTGDGKAIDQIVAETAVLARCWYFVAAGYSRKTGKAWLRVINCVNAWNSRYSTVVPFELDSWLKETLRTAPARTARHVRFMLAAASESNPSRGPHSTLLFNGKIDRAGIYGRQLKKGEVEQLSKGEIASRDGLLAYWDPTQGYSDKGIGDVIEDIGPHALHLDGINRPVRCMTGFNWRGADSFRLAPSEYGGVHYHDDALTDSHWETTLSWDVPTDLKSGVYGLRLSTESVSDHIVFIVRPAKPMAKIAVLLPTFTYLAYANEHLAYEAPIAQAITAHTPVIVPEDLEYKKLEEFGLSTYDHHTDGAGCCYSSWRRPIISLRPRYRMPAMNFPWALPADLSLIWWLEHAGYAYDVITDHDLHAEGKALLEPYKTVLNGTHPEYYSEEMMDASEQYLAGGGRILYIGGNGYYWVTGLRDGEPHCIEVRKLDTGSRAWQAEPGEGYLACTGERSGLWRSRGRAPQKIVGLGFSAEGMDESQPFERMPDSYHKRVAWIFKGLDEKEKIGDFGLAAGGAAGVELDRYELGLGTPPHTMLLASSWGHSDNYPLVSEEVTYAFPGRGGTQDPQVRGDMIYFTTPNNGAVFAAGSIAWSQALPCHGGENSVARVMRNVLDAFIGDGQLPGTAYSGDEKLWR